MEERPHRLPYARPQKPDEDSPRWLSKLGAIFAMFVGTAFLLIGIGNIIALFGWREESWKANLFMGFVGTLAGFVFTIRPLYRMMRGRNWWTVR